MALSFCVAFMTLEVYLTQLVPVAVIG